MHLRVVDDGPGLRMVLHLLQREWGAQDVFGHRPAPIGVRRADAHRVVQAEARVAPAEELADESLCLMVSSFNSQ